MDFNRGARLACRSRGYPHDIAPGAEAVLQGNRKLWQKSFPLPSWLIVNAEGRVAERTVGVPLAEAAAGQVRLANVRDAIDPALRQHQASSGAGG